MSVNHDKILAGMRAIPYDYIVNFYEIAYEKDLDVDISLLDKIMDVIIEKAFLQEVGVYVDKRFDRLDWILAQLIEYGGEDKFIKANQLMQNLMNTKMDSKAYRQALMVIIEFDCFGVGDANVKSWLHTQKECIKVSLR